jgi:Fur family ferric uptake transcriptional regulator
MRISPILIRVQDIRPALILQGEIGPRIHQHLKDLDIRFTRGRRLVVAALQRSPGPQSASELQSRLGASVPLSSLYRTLAVLDEAGVLERIHGPHGVARYELAEWLTGHHDHLVCVECGATEDVELEEELEATIAGFAQKVSGPADFEVAGHSLHLEGVCARCRS